MLIFNSRKKIYIKEFFVVFLVSFFIFIFTSTFVFAQTEEGLTTSGNIVDPSPNPDVLNDTGTSSGTQTLSPTSSSSNPGTYTLLAPLPGLENYNVDAVGGEGCALSKYFNVLIKLFIGISAVLAMIMIVIGGIQYMTSESISAKGAGLEQARNAVFGLILALGAYAILNTINPQLLNLCPNIPKAKIVIGPAQEGAAGSFSAISPSALTAMGINCPGSGGESQIASIAQSFNGKVTYSNSQRGTIGTSPSTVYLDCSSFVKQVYACAGMSLPGDTTATMFPSSETVSGSVINNSVNGIPLQVGDLLGWIQGESSQYTSAGHVVMYIGGGQYIEVHGGSGTNGAVGINSINHYNGSYFHIIR